MVYGLHYLVLWIYNYTIICRSVKMNDLLSDMKKKEYSEESSASGLSAQMKWPRDDQSS